MPIDKFVLIIVSVFAAAGATVWVCSLIFVAFELPFAWLVLIPVVLAGYVLWRVISERMNSDEDTHYDEMDH